MSNRCCSWTLRCFTFAWYHAEYRSHLVRSRVLYDFPNDWMIANGIGRDWPDARGFFFNQNKTVIAWGHEEDHLQVMSLFPGGDFATAFREWSCALLGA